MVLKAHKTSDLFLLFIFSRGLYLPVFIFWQYFIPLIIILDGILLAYPMYFLVYFSLLQNHTRRIG